MATLPRVEQPYTAIYPHLDVACPVKLIVVDDTQSHETDQTSDATSSLHPQSSNTGTTAVTTTASPATSDDPANGNREDVVPTINPPTSAQFNVPGFVGGPPGKRRFLPLKHARHTPPPVVDPEVLNAGVGYVIDQEKLSPATSETLIRPDAAMEIYRPFTYRLPTKLSELEDFLTKHIRVEYDIDEADLGVLGALATNYRVQMLPEVFEVAMSMLDVSAAVICLKMHPLERAAYNNSSTSAAQTVENRKCAVCNWAECSDSNTIVFCDGCDVAVHQDCYGVHSIPEGRWLCNKCDAGAAVADSVRCLLCPWTSGAFKRTIAGDWIHLVCALWTPVIRVPDDTSFLQPIRDVELMDPARWTLNCYVCRRKRSGACIQCAARDCYVAFHPTCAQAAGFYMTDCEHDFTEILRNQQFLPVYCHKHTPAHAPRGREMSPPSLEAAREALENEAREAEKRDVSLFAKQRFPYWRTRSHALILPQIVVEAVQRSLRARLGVDIPIPALEFLCRYWTIKKDMHDGVMFSRRMYHALEVAEYLLVRAEQSEEQDFTPRELLAVVNDLIKVLRPHSPPPKAKQEKPKEQTKQPPNNAAKRNFGGRPSINNRTTPHGKKTPSSSPSSKESTAATTTKTTATTTTTTVRRRMPSTRKRVREQTATVASSRKLRSRKPLF